MRISDWSSDVCSSDLKDDVQPRTSLSPCSARLAVIRAPRLATSGPAEDVVEDAFDAERLIGVEENVEVLTGDGGFLRVHYPEDSVNFGSADDETPLDRKSTRLNSSP